jgi:hypothetical protein
MNAIFITKLRQSKEKFFKLRVDSERVYTLNHFDRSSQKYSISPVDDINEEKFILKSRLVFVGFDY